MINKEKLLEQLKEIQGYCINKNNTCSNCEVREICDILEPEGTPDNWILTDNIKRWRADMGGAYWCVTDGCMVATSIEGAIDYDNYRYYTHNYFKTEKEAKTYARVLETEMLLKKFADEHNYKPINWKDTDEQKYFLIVAYDTSELAVYSTFDNREPRIVHFNSKEIAQDAINEIGEDRIIEYLTYEW